MEHSIHELPDGTYHRFVMDEGSVWVRVVPVGGGAGELGIYEQEAAIAGIGLSDEVSHKLPQHAAARHRFGYKAMRRIIETVRDAHPDIHLCRSDTRHKSIVTPGRVHERAI